MGAKQAVRSQPASEQDDFFASLGFQTAKPRKADLLMEGREQRAEVATRMFRREAHFDRVLRSSYRSLDNTQKTVDGSPVLPIGHIPKKGRKYKRHENADGTVNEHVDAEAMVGANVSIHPTATMGTRPSIGNNVSIGENVAIGESVMIEDDAIVPKGTQIPDYFTARMEKRKEGTKYLRLIDPNEIF